MLSLQKKIVKLLPKTVQKNLPCEIAVVTISKDTSRRLNRTYRGNNYSANVLSFRYDRDYGEILLCLPMIRREARSARHPFEYQRAWMIVHGILHLAGVHHEKSRAAATKFEYLERALLTKLLEPISEHGINLSHRIRHRDVNGTDRDCPP